MKSKLLSISSPKALTIVITALTMLFAIYYIRTRTYLPWLSLSSTYLITEFEGTYYMGDGLGVSCAFRVNPDATFTIVWGTDIGFREEYAGSISVENMQFVLTPNKDMDDFVLCFYPTLIPLYWGARRYLLPIDELSHYFCQEVKDGDEPRNSPFGYPYLRGTDLNISVLGGPRRVNGQLYCPPS